MVAVTAASMVMQFTPVTALLGGLTLGICSVAKFATTGRILGISGALKGCVQADLSPWRVLFTAGMLLGAYAAKEAVPYAFDALPPTFTVARGALGGFLVGLGSAIGNGCTSGHGISGNARLSVRSAFYTVVFMLSAMAAATLTHTLDSLGVSGKAASLAWPTNEVAKSGALLVVAALGSFTALAKAAQVTSNARMVEWATELLSGLLFSFGLVYSGMVRPSKVAAFLSPSHPAWDLSLAFVMGGALLVALPGFQAILHWKVLRKPLACDEFHIPVVNTIDPMLLLGGVLFGAGWGVSGMCPGPAIVAVVGTPVPPVLANVAAMLLGMWINKVAFPKASCAAKEAMSKSA